MSKRRSLVAGKTSGTNARVPAPSENEKKLEGSDDQARSASERVDIELRKNDSSTGTMKEMMEPLGGDETIDMDLDYIQNTLRHFPWYHGLIQSTHVFQFLKWDHSYLVRRSGETQKGHEFFCLSHRLAGRIHHNAFKYEGGYWVCPKMPLEMDPSLRFNHIHTLLDYWSLKCGGLTAVPRSKFILQHDDVKLLERLGAGAFGEVWKGSVVLEGVAKDCAVKKIKGKISRAEITSFFHEAKIMSLFNHDCIIKFYGQCTLISPLMAVMELAAGGVVRHFLRRNRNTTHDVLVGFANDIARGMEHLTSLKVIHRDLAARNCLLDSKNTVKISDFGLSVRAEEIRVTNLKQAPIRWLSPETIKFGIFNEKTDVWAFGVTVWEIFTYCKYQPLYPKPIKEATHEITEGDRPHRFNADLKLQPPREIVSVVEHCTRHQPKDRPKFRALVLDIGKIREQTMRGNVPSRRRQPFRSLLSHNKSGEPNSLNGLLRKRDKRFGKRSNSNPLTHRLNNNNNSATPPGSQQVRSQVERGEKSK